MTRIKLRHPDTGAELECAPRAVRVWAKSGWVEVDPSSERVHRPVDFVAAEDGEPEAFLFARPSTDEDEDL